MSVGNNVHNQGVPRETIAQAPGQPSCDDFASALKVAQQINDKFKSARAIAGILIDRNSIDDYINDDNIVSKIMVVEECLKIKKERGAKLDRQTALLLKKIPPHLSYRVVESTANLVRKSNTLKEEMQILEKVFHDDPALFTPHSHPFITAVLDALP